MSNLKEILKERRPTLSESSIKTYTSILKSLHKKVFENEEFKESNLEKSGEILEYLKDVPPNKRKTILSALVVLTGKDDYRERMNDDVSEYNKEIQKQEASETQRDNWISTDEINEIFRGLENDAKILYKKTNKTPSDIQQIQNYVIVALCSGIFFAPRRSMDWCEMLKVMPELEQRSEVNYINKGKFIFNKFKTAKYHEGGQTIDIPIQVKNILNRWIAINPTNYLLHDNHGNKLTNVKLNQRINRIFGGKKVSVNNFRHTYLTDRYKETSEQNKKLAKDMSDMGSSENMAINYIKIK